MLSSGGHVELLKERFFAQRRNAEETPRGANNTGEHSIVLSRLDARKSRAATRVARRTKVTVWRRFRGPRFNDRVHFFEDDQLRLAVAAATQEHDFLGGIVSEGVTADL